VIAAFRLFWRLALSVFFRRVTVEGLERVPADGPLLVVANHTNAFVDALLLLAWLPRRLVVTAKGSLRRNPLLDLVFFRGHGVVALERAEDTAAGERGAARARNGRTLEALGGRLAAGEAVLLFPEGVSHSDGALRPFRPGAARLATDVVAREGRPLTVLPVGLVYEDKGRPRSDVTVRIGAPLVVDGPRDAGALTDELAARVRDLARPAPGPCAPRPRLGGRAVGALRALEGLVLGAPGAALGALLHGLPVAVVRGLSRLLSTDEDHRATNTVVPALGVFPLYYALLLGLVAALLPVWAFALLLLVLPWSALVALAWVDQLREVLP
jgi:1-acyl-sn-glycerol-3-phosphate acyltransferase